MMLFSPIFHRLNRAGLAALQHAVGLDDWMEVVVGLGSFGPTDRVIGVTADSRILTSTSVIPWSLFFEKFLALVGCTVTEGTRLGFNRLWAATVPSSQHPNTKIQRITGALISSVADANDVGAYPLHFSRIYLAKLSSQTSLSTWMPMTLRSLSLWCGTGTCH